MEIRLPDLLKEKAKPIIKFQNNQAVVSSREVSEHFEKRHDNILRDVEGYKKDVLNFGEMFQESQEADSYGRMQKVYLMNRDGFTLLAMGFTGQKALQWKIKYIQAFNEMEQQLKSKFLVPTTFAEALRLAADQAEQIQKQEQQLIAQAPHVRFAKAVESTDNEILIRDLAKIIAQNGIDIGEKRLFNWMRMNNYLTLKNRPTQRSIDLGVMVITECVIMIGGSSRVAQTTKITGKGQTYFVDKFLKEKTASVTSTDGHGVKGFQLPHPLRL